MAQQSLFPLDGAAFAGGYAYETPFPSSAGESALIAGIPQPPPEQTQDKQFRAKRRIVSYGGRYDFTAQQLNEGVPIAPFLLPLRARAAQWAGVPAMISRTRSSPSIRRARSSAGIGTCRTSSSSSASR